MCSLVFLIPASQSQYIILKLCLLSLFSFVTERLDFCCIFHAYFQ